MVKASDVLGGALEKLLENKLIFGRIFLAGRDEAVDYLLCVIVDDDELPWDTTQTD